MESRHDDQGMNTTEVVSTSTSSMEMSTSSEVMDNKAIREKSTPSPSSDSVILRPSDEDEFEDEEESENSLNSDEIRNESVPGTSGQQKPIYFYFRMRSINIINKGTENSSKEGYYKCHICDRPYLQKFSLKRHFVRNHIDPKYLSPADIHNCNIKGKPNSQDGVGDSKSSAGRKKYKDVNALYVDNNKTTILKGLYMCNFCHGVRFDLEEDLKAHYLQHINEKKPAEFPCNLCNEVFPNKIALSKHASSHSQPLRCSICNLDFPVEAEFLAHMATHGSKTQCKYCGKRLTTAANKKKHENLHEGGRGFTCKHCLQVFKDSNTLELHIKKKHSKNPLTCQLCPKTGHPEVFNSQAQLTAHIAAVHPNAPRKRKDNVTPKPGPSASSPKPGPSASSPKPGPSTSSPKAICPVCGQAFQDIRAMLTHKAFAHKKKGCHSNLPRKNSPLRRPCVAKVVIESSSSGKADVQDSKTRGKNKVLRKRPTYKRKAKQPIKSKVMKRKIALSKKELALKEKQEERDFYSNLAQSIANNLLHHLDGKANQLRIKTYTFRDDSEEQRTDQFNIPWSAFNFPKDFDVDLALERRGREIKVRASEEQCLLATGLRKVVPSPTEKDDTLSSQEHAESNGMTHTEDNSPLNAESSLNTTGLQKLKEIDTLLDVEEINERPKGLKTRKISGRRDFEINSQLKRSMPVNQRKVSPLTMDEKLDMIYYEERTVLICTVCQERFSSDDHFDEHCINNHPNIEVSSLKVVSDKASPPVIPRDLSRPLYPNSSTGALFSYSVPTAQPSRWTCTKCKLVFSSTSVLHVHMVSCGGDTFSSTSQRKRNKLKRIKHTMKHRIDLSVNRNRIQKKGIKESKTRPLTKASNKLGKDFFSTNTSKTVRVFFCDYCKTSFRSRLKRQEHYDVCPVFYKRIESQKSSKVTHVVTQQSIAKKNITMRITTIRSNQVDRVDSQDKVTSQKNPVAPVVINGEVGAKHIPAKIVPLIQNSNSAMDLSVKLSSSTATLPATPLDTLQQMCQSMECGTSSKSSQATVPRINPKNTSASNGNAQLHVKGVAKPEPKKHSAPLLKIKEVVQEIKRAASASNLKKASSQKMLTCLQKLGTSTKSSSVSSLSINMPAHIVRSINQQTLILNSPSVSQETPVTNQDADTSRRKRKLEMPVKKIKRVGNVADANIIPELNTISKEKDKPSDLSVAAVSLGKDGVVQEDMPELLASKEKGSTTEKDLSSHFSKEKDSANQELSKSLSLNDSVQPKDLSKLPISKEKVSAQDKGLDKSLVPNEKDGAKQGLSKPLALNDSINQKDMSKSTDPTNSKDKCSLNEKSSTKSLVPNEKDSMRKNDLSKSLVSKGKDVAKQVNLTNELASKGKDLAKQTNLTKLMVLKEKDAVKQVNLTKVLVPNEKDNMKNNDLSKSLVPKDGDVGKQVNLTKLASKGKDLAKQANLTKVLVLKENNAAKQVNLTTVLGSKDKDATKQVNLTKGLVSKEANKVKQIDSSNSLVPSEKDNRKEVNLSKTLGPNENNVTQQKNLSKSPVLKEKEVSKSLIPNEKDSIPNINHVIKQKDLPKLLALKEVGDKQKSLPKSQFPKENIKQNATNLKVSKVVLPFSNSHDQREDTIKQVDSLVSDRSISESSSTETPNMAKSVNQVNSVTPGAKQIKDKVDQVEKLNMLAKKDVDNKVAKDSVACNSLPNIAIVERPAELIFSTGEGDKELDSSGRESPTLANLVSSVTQNIEGFDDQDDEKFTLPSPFLPSMNCDSMTKESSNGSLSFQIVIPRNENQSGSFLNGVGLPSDSFCPFPIMNSSVGNVLQELDKSKKFTTSESLIANQNAVIAVSKPHDVDSLLKVSSSLTSCSLTKQVNSPLNLGKEAFREQHQASMDKNKVKPLVPDATSPSSILPTCQKDPLDKDSKDAASSNISSMKNSVATGKNLSSEVSVSLETSYSLHSTADDNSSKSTGQSPKKKGQESYAFSNKRMCIETNSVTAQLQSETDIERADSSQRESQDETAKPDEPSVKSAQLRAFRVLKSISTEKSSLQEENSSPTDFAEKMKEKFRKSFGSGSTSTLAAISIAASDAATLNRAESVANSCTPTSDTLVDNNAEPPDSSVKEESEPNEEDSGRGPKEFEKHTCPYCFLEFAYLTNFRRHLKTCQNKRSEEVVQAPSTNTGVTRLQHLPKKDEVEGSMLHLLRHQSRQSQMIKEVNKDPETIVSPDLKFQKFVCEDCHKIYLSLFKLMQHRLKDHKMGSDAKAIMSAHQQVLEDGEEAFQDNWEDTMYPESNVADCEMENDANRKEVLDQSYSEGLECQEEVPEEQIGMQLAQAESNSNSQEEMELGEVIEHKEGEIDHDSVNSPESENRVDVYEPSRDTTVSEADGSVASEADAEVSIAPGQDAEEDSTAPEQVEDSIPTNQDAEIFNASAANAEDSIASEVDAKGSIASEANADDSIAPGSTVKQDLATKTLIEQPLTKDDAVFPNKYKELLDPSFLVLPAFGKGRGRKKKDASETDGDVKEQEALSIVPLSKKNKGRIKRRGKAKFTALKIKEKSKAKLTTLNMKTKKEFKKLGPKRRGPKASKAPSKSMGDSAPITSVKNAVPIKGRRGRKPRELKKLELEEKKDSEAQENKRGDVPTSENVLEKDHVLTVMKNVPSQSASTSMSRRGKKMPPKTNLITNLKCKKVKFNDDELSAFASPLIDSHSTISFSSDLTIVKEKANPSKTLPNPSSGSVKVIKLKSETILSTVDSSTKASNTKGNRVKRSAGSDNAGDSAKKSAKQPAFLIDYYKIESSPPTSPINDKMNIKAIKAIPKSICDIQSLRSPAVVGRKPPSIRTVTIVTDEDSEVDDLPDTRQEAQRKKVCPICKKRFPSALLRNRHVALVHPRKNRGDVEPVADQEEKQGRSSQRQCTKPAPAVKRRNQKTQQSSDSKRRRL